MKTSRINLTKPEIIKAFFGTPIREYDYTVTQDDFDEYDNEAPGHYVGIEVPEAAGQLWDAGIEACKAKALGTQTREGYTLRLTIMYPAGVPDHANQAVDAYLARIGKQEAARQSKLIAQIQGKPGEIIPCLRAPGMYVRVSGSPERQAYIRAVADRATIDCGWLSMSDKDDTRQYDPEFLRVLRAYWDITSPGWTHRNGTPAPDSTLIALHAHSGIKHHLEGEYVSDLDSAVIDIPRLERAHKLSDLASQIGITKAL